VHLSFTGNALGTHNHTFSGNALAAHNHTFTGNALGTHNHTFTGNALPAHSHTYSTFAGGAGAYAAFTAGSVNTWDSFSTSSVSAGTPSGSISSVSAGTPSGSISSVSAGTPSGSISSVSAGTPSGTVSAPTFFGNALAAHSHTTDIAPFASASTGVAIGTTSADGTGTTGSNNPPFVVVNYIIKY